MALIGLTFISMTSTAVIRYVRVVRPSLQRYLKPKRTCDFLTVVIVVAAHLASFVCRISRRTLQRETWFLSLALQ